MSLLASWTQISPWSLEPSSGSLTWPKILYEVNRALRSRMTCLLNASPILKFFRSVAVSALAANLSTVYALHLLQQNFKSFHAGFNFSLSLRVTFLEKCSPTVLSVILARTLTYLLENCIKLHLLKHHNRTACVDMPLQKHQNMPPSSTFSLGLTSNGM